MACFRLDTEQVKLLTFRARATYYSALFLATNKDMRSRLEDREITLFDVVPRTTYYRHRKEIFEKTGLDLNDLFPASQARYLGGF